MSIDQLQVHTGGCLCGSVRYKATGEPVIVALCYCEDCQRASGAGHSTGVMFPDDCFQLTGQIAEFKLTSNRGNEVTKSFCPTCGSPLTGRNSGMKGFVTVSLGTMDDSSNFEPQVAVFDRNRKPWDITDENLTTFNEQPDWKPKGRME